MTSPSTASVTSYPPSDEFAEQANATAALYDEADADRLAFWAAQAQRLAWETPFTEVLDWSEAPVAKWFADGAL
ncbi:acetyl-coenzyme A synthetase N-terminal domain-containing protein, partial [Mycobacterium sp. NPDC006124]|uniref:acetyl-coenzyme A synthetase N-terminal domain-containing protein n=1 Tax=Mycobacterium sp. NPDC006124 TaxID=3156729 RepID=UPI00339EF0A0